MRYLYTLIFWLLLPFILLRLLYRSLRAPAYRKRILERFGYFQNPQKPTEIWIHAVSLGEVIAATPLVRALQKEYPDMGVVITNMTPTGSDRVRSVLGENVFNVYVPYDLPTIVTRFIKKTQPKLLIIIETELWPNLIHICHQHKIPILLANARLSAKSAHHYNRIAALTKQMLQKITLIAAQTQVEAERFIHLGAPQNQVVVTGSIKFDITIPTDLRPKAAAIRELLGVNRPVWIVASTHESEEEKILQTFAKVREQIDPLLLFLVPRHPERFTKVESLCRKQGYQVAMRSHQQPCDPSINIVIGDTMGELLVFYAASDVAFVGGSLAPIGGHNLLEPVALGIPTITGPHMHNFMEITALLLQAQAIRQVQSSDEIAKVVLELLRNAHVRETMAQQGLQVIAQNRGALQKQLELVTICFKKPPL